MRKLVQLILRQPLYDKISLHSSILFALLFNMGQPENES